MTKHHVIAALVDAGMSENDSESWVESIDFRSGDTPPNWRQELLDARSEALAEGEQFDRAYDNLVAHT